MNGTTAVRHPGIKVVLLSFVGVLVLGLFAFSFMLVATDPDDDLVLIRSGMTVGPSGSRTVVGAVKNRADRPYSQVHVQIEFRSSVKRWNPFGSTSQSYLAELLSSGGQIIGTASASTDVLDVGQTWNFEVPVNREDAAGIRIKVTSPDNNRPEWLGGCATTRCPPG